jgi:hypothetical protein
LAQQRRDTDDRDGGGSAGHDRIGGLRGEGAVREDRKAAASEGCDVRSLSHCAEGVEHEGNEKREDMVTFGLCVLT